jgi:ATP phosphoribosyltransferase regulatory subunit HisZ
MKVHANARRAAFEKRESRNRKQQECRHDIIKELRKDNLFMNTVASDVRVEHKRRLRQMGIEDLEKATLMAHFEVVILNLRTKRRRNKFRKLYAERNKL